MKRILTIQDISCVGKCSLTVALPILSAMGLETAVLPTAVLSAHTVFPNFTFRDLTADIEPISRHWQAEGIGFDAIYTGYLGSLDQLRLIDGLFDRFRTEKTLIVVDPVMADNGKLYPGFTQEFAKKMAGLCAKADVILPNMTEASFLLGIPYIAEGYDANYVKGLLVNLTKLGVKKAVLTGVSFEPDKLGIMGYDALSCEFFQYFTRRIPASFHGTGDVFASTCVGGLMNSLPLHDALALAADYTVACIEDTVCDPNRRWYGVNFEPVLPMLMRRLGK